MRDNIPIQPKRNLQAQWVARMRALAGHVQRWHQKRAAVPALPEGAAARTLTQAGRRKRVEGVAQDQRATGQCTFQPTNNLQVRGVARVRRALARHGCSCSQRPAVPAVPEGAAVRTLSYDEEPAGVEGVVPSGPSQVYKYDG